MAKKIDINGLDHFKEKENAMIASEYSSSKTYAVGDYVYHNGTLYKCTTAITTEEAWTSGHWTAAKLADDCSGLMTAFDYFKSTELIPVEINNMTGARYVTTQFNLAAGTYHLHVDNITSTDTDATTCAINLGGGSGIKQYARGVAIDTDITLVADSTTQYFYASDNANHSNGDSVAFTNVVISKSITNDISDALSTFIENITPNSGNTTGGYINYTNGNTATSSSHFYTDFIDVSKYDYIEYSNCVVTSDNAVGGIAFYSDKNQSNYISGIQATRGSTAYTYANNKIIVPYNAKYARFSGFLPSMSDDKFFIYGLINNSITSEPAKKVSIIGDSVSAYNQLNYMTYGYTQYYPNQNAPDVNKVTKTWWKMFLDNSGAVLEKNAAYSGSRVTDTNSPAPDFYARCNSTVLGNPDTIIVELGANDSRHSVDIGEYDFTTATASLDETTFRPAYIKGIKTLQSNFPNAKIIALILNMGNDYSVSIKTICKRLGVEYVEIADYTTAEGTHPDAHGMKQIASAISYPQAKNKKFYTTDITSVININTTNVTLQEGYFAQNGDMFIAKLVYVLNVDITGSYIDVGTVRIPLRPTSQAVGYGFRYENNVQYPIFAQIVTSGQIRHYNQGVTGERDTVYFQWFAN